MCNSNLYYLCYTSGYPYTNLAASVLGRDNISPNEGSKTDPAHPAIYPTGEKPKDKLAGVELKLFDLIIRRFLATFGDPTITEHIIITIQVTQDHIFEADGNEILYE